MLPKLTFNPGVGSGIFMILIIFMQQQSITTGDLSTDYLEADFTGAIVKPPSKGLSTTLELFDRISFRTTNETIQVEMQSRLCFDWEKVTINLYYLNFLGGFQEGPGRYYYDLTLLPHRLFIEKDGRKWPQPIFNGTLPIVCYDEGIQMTFYGVSNLRRNPRPTTTTTTTTMRPPPTRRRPKSRTRPNFYRPTPPDSDPFYNVKTTELTPTTTEPPSVTGLNLYFISIYTLIATVSGFVVVFGVYLTCKKLRKRDSGVNIVPLNNTTTESRHRQRQYPLSNRHRLQSRHPTDQNQYIPTDNRPPAPSAPLIESDSPPEYKDVVEDFSIPPPSYEEAIHSHHVPGS